LIPIIGLASSGIYLAYFATCTIQKFNSMSKALAEFGFWMSRQGYQQLKMRIFELNAVGW
jgi:hypothetical protein